MSAPDISREACERLAERLDYDGLQLSSATLRALRAALDAAERERDEARDDYETAMVTATNADATNYARGVRDAAAKVLDHWITVNMSHNANQRELDARVQINAAILALLPKERTP
jgi:hypothetical protein